MTLTEGSLYFNNWDQNLCFHQKTKVLLTACNRFSEDGPLARGSSCLQLAVSSWLLPFFFGLHLSQDFRRSVWVRRTFFTLTQTHTLCSVSDSSWDFKDLLVLSSCYYYLLCPDTLWHYVYLQILEHYSRLSVCSLRQQALDVVAFRDLFEGKDNKQSDVDHDLVDAPVPFINCSSPFSSCSSEALKGEASKTRIRRKDRQRIVKKTKKKNQKATFETFTEMQFEMMESPLCAFPYVMVKWLHVWSALGWSSA